MSEKTQITEIPKNAQVVTIEELYRQYGEICVNEKIILGRKAILEQQLQQILNQQPQPK